MEKNEGARPLSGGWFDLGDVKSDPEKKEKIILTFFRALEHILATHNDTENFEFIETFVSTIKDYVHLADYAREHNLKWSEIKAHAGV